MDLTCNARRRLPHAAGDRQVLSTGPGGAFPFHGIVITRDYDDHPPSAIP